MINSGYIILGFSSKTFKRKKKQRNAEKRKIREKCWNDSKKECIFNGAAALFGRTSTTFTVKTVIGYVTCF